LEDLTKSVLTASLPGTFSSDTKQAIPSPALPAHVNAAYRYVPMP